MDKVSEILSNIKDRLANPFIFSFVVSWFIYNWRIPIALIWFDEKQISANGCSSIFEFIQDDWRNNGYFWWPLIWAFLYTFGFPLFKNLVSAFQTWTVKWGENWNLKISKNGNISIDKYLILRNDYVSKIEELQDIISKESQIKEYNKELFAEKADLDSKNFQLQQHILMLENSKRSVSNINFLNGSWKVTTINHINNVKDEIEIYIEKGTIYSVNNKVRTPICQIIDFYYDVDSNRIIFLKDFYKKDKVFINFDSRFKVNRLSLNGDGSLSGTENFDDITYVKYKY